MRREGGRGEKGEKERIETRKVDGARKRGFGES